VIPQSRIVVSVVITVPARMIVPVSLQRVLGTWAEDSIDLTPIVAGVCESVLQLGNFRVVMVSVPVGVAIVESISVAVTITGIDVVTAAIVPVRITIGITIIVRITPPAPEWEPEVAGEDDIVIVMMMMPVPIITPMAVPMLTIPMLDSPVLTVPMLTNKMLAVPVLAIPRSDSVAASERPREPDSCRYRGEVVGAPAMGPSAKCRCSESCRQEATQVRQGFRIHRVSGS